MSHLRAPLSPISPINFADFADFANVWSCLELSGVVWSCLELSGVVWSCLELSGVVWSCLECLFLDECWSRQAKIAPYHVKPSILVSIMAFGK
jgi:hypothetical protein